LAEVLPTLLYFISLYKHYRETKRRFIEVQNISSYSSLRRSK